MTTSVKRAAPRKTTPAKPPANPVGKPNTQMHRRGKGQFSDWADAVADANITTVDELYEFLENTRAFFQEASSLVEVMAKQFDHDLKLTVKKKESKWDFLGLSFGGRFRKAVREMQKIADSCEAAAKHAYACWTAYEKDSLEMQEEIRAAEIASRHGNKGAGGFDHGF
jgi:undecaprenyl pyrophosphate synthase